MTPQLHTELARLCDLFHFGSLSDEEWALLQIHMAYCDSCHSAFATGGLRGRLVPEQQSEV